MHSANGRTTALDAIVTCCALPEPIGATTIAVMSLQNPLTRPTAAAPFETISTTSKHPGSEQPVGPVDLAGLIHHRDRVDSHVLLSEVQSLFQKHSGDYRAIVEGPRVVGLCSRATIGFMLGSRYGFSLNSNRTVWVGRAPRPLIYSIDTPLARVLDEALSRTGSEFFEDIILVDREGALVGLIPVPNLAKLQLQLYGEQRDRAVMQDSELRQQNLELFQINHQLRQSQGRYKILFENNALGVALLDSQGAIVAHNRRLEQLLRLSESAPPNNFLLELWIHPGELPAWRSHLSKIQQDEPDAEPRVAEIKFELPSSGTRLFELHTSWVVEAGQICVFFEDITEQQSLEKRMAQHDKQTMLDTLVAGVAHELNNKLTPIMGFAELLQALTPAGELQGYSRCIQQSAQEASRIIRQLLDLSRPSSEAFSQFDAGLICRDAIEMMRFQLREANCEASVHTPPGAALVQGDVTQLKQVLINLILNAVHAMEGQPKPRLTISVSATAGAIWLRVRDNGSGIKPAVLARIFDPFFTTKGPRGTGLGLSISSSIIRQHGGELSVESAPGVGTTFSIRLPASLSITPPKTTSRAPLNAEPRPSPVPSLRRVLVVDDEEFVSAFMHEALRRSFGCSVETATDGADAVAKLAKANFDLIVTDIRMPIMDGFQLRIWLANNRPELAARVVFVTGHPGSSELDHVMGELGCPVIRKPFTIEDVVAICRPYLERASGT